MLWLYESLQDLINKQTVFRDYDTVGAIQVLWDGKFWIKCFCNDVKHLVIDTWKAAFNIYDSFESNFNDPKSNELLFSKVL